MKIASAVIALNLLTQPAALAASEQVPESLLFQHICRATYGEAACRCALPLLIGRVPNDRLNAELREHGGAFFARSSLAPLVASMMKYCMPTRPTVAETTCD